MITACSLLIFIHNNHLSEIRYASIFSIIIGSTMTLDMRDPSTPSRSSTPIGNRLTSNSFVQSPLKALSPSPLLRDTAANSKDDQYIVPTTPQRPNLPRGLSLQTPKQNHTSQSPLELSTSDHVLPIPKLDPSIFFGSSILPRRTRGLDFSRACTNLHHSTLAESSPDSSPVIGYKGMSTPRRSGSVMDSPMVSSTLWSTQGSERVSGISIGSHLVDTSDSSDMDEDMAKDEEDVIHMTPQPMRGYFMLANIQSPDFDPMTNSPARKRYASFAQRCKTKSRRKIPLVESPGNLSPPSTRSESNGYSGRQSRRGSLNLGTTQLNLSDDVPLDALGLSHPQVVRRTVTRRSNMLVSSFISRHKYFD